MQVGPVYDFNLLLFLLFAGLFPDPVQPMRLQEFHKILLIDAFHLGVLLHCCNALHVRQIAFIRSEEREQRAIWPGRLCVVGLVIFQPGEITNRKRVHLIHLLP